MDRYTDLVISKIPELGFTNLLCHIYSIAGLCTTIDVSRFVTNCNGYVIERLDKSPTAGRVSCVPIGELLALVRAGHLPPPRTLPAPSDADPEAALAAELARKRELVNALRARFSPEDAMRLTGTVPLAYFFKPRLREKVSRAIDFSQMDLKVDDLARAGVRTGINEKIVRIPIQPERGAWMSNRSIQQLVTPFAHGSEVDYLGQFNLNFLNSAAVHEKASRFSSNMLYLILKEKVAGAKARFVMLGFCYLSHWKCAIFDKKNKLLAFYDSGGNSPHEFFHYPNFYFYSFYDGFNTNSRSASLDTANADIDVLFRFFVDEFGAKSGCINREVNQLLESECGMFTSLFMVLCTLTPPDDFKSLRRVYTFFRFLADKKMTLFKSILFDVGEPTLEVREAVSDGLREYMRMERWTRKSALVLSERISERINKLLGSKD
ncbi:processing peptidase-cysteine peptidase MEROPS peptidase family C57 (clan CE) [Squirrelpox virus]|uniref:Processing peptidase-cysteine peptidase MEROPS peptidase family C57 (Clan CE) n=1 Tax=Squirrelpox virus TaxID=240426 RepID=U3UBI4_9POXV|nr:processing peptidase-cysteine peptidase MEROPS peptidase family C57 (clan CE) [Squirrelpox virus]CCD83225.1 processing peptidase-cysteine peptidase MEROPS peptidase family C57 (clan CE) [Squirrelpox virus]